VSVFVHSRRVSSFTSDTLHSSDLNQEPAADKHARFFTLVPQPVGLLTLQIKRLGFILSEGFYNCPGVINGKGVVITKDFHFVWQISFVTSCRLAYRIDLALSVDCQHARRRSGDGIFVG